MTSVHFDAIALAAEELPKHKPIDKRGSATVCACGTWYNTMLDPRAAELHAMRKALEVAAPYIGADAIWGLASRVPEVLPGDALESVRDWLAEESDEMRPVTEEP